MRFENDKYLEKQYRINFCLTNFGKRQHLPIFPGIYALKKNGSSKSI